jgi:repressor LexA
LSKASPRQQQMLNFIYAYIEEHAYPPSVRDIQQACEISSTSVVHYNLHILQREGFIHRDPEVSRGLEVLDGSASSRSSIPGVPVIGYIAAGSPLPAADGALRHDPLETVTPPDGIDTRGIGDLYALRVRGLSMIDALIDDGDVVIFRPATEAGNGDMVAAWLIEEQEATLKRIYHEGANVRLQPANSQMEPIIVPADNIEIKGRVVAVIRRLE